MKNYQKHNIKWRLKKIFILLQGLLSESYMIFISSMDFRLLTLKFRPNSFGRL